MEIRDPVHGPIEVSPAEKAVIDHPLVQRLRRVRQLGFAETTWPGATHTRFLHSVGALHLAGLAFDAVARDLHDLPAAALRRTRASIRLAALLHDLGHPPFSHAGEIILPRLSDVDGVDAEDPGRTATHEEMTRWLVLRSDLADTIARSFAGDGVSPADVAAILRGGTADEDRFLEGGVSLLPLLHQLIAGELDVDRMDYLLRDSYFTGVSYGRFDRDWILSHLGSVVSDGVASLALDGNAFFAFEDFLLSRHHMFLMVYTHHKSLGYGRMLERFLAGAGRGLRAPAAPDGFVACDDEWLLAEVRRSDDEWARRIVERRPLRRVVEAWDADARELDALRPALESRLPPTIEWIASVVDFPAGVSRGPGAGAVVRLQGPGTRRAFVPLVGHGDLFVHRAEPKRVLRLYCRDEDAADVERVVGDAFLARPDEGN